MDQIFDSGYSFLNKLSKIKAFFRIKQKSYIDENNNNYSLIDIQDCYKAIDISDNNIL